MSWSYEKVKGTLRGIALRRKQSLGDGRFFPHPPRKTLGLIKYRIPKRVIMIPSRNMAVGRFRMGDKARHFYRSLWLICRLASNVTVG